MPAKTFFKLSQEKQDTIIAQSIKAFSRGTFYEVKVSTIIKLSGIPRASFYDYFEDKLDLYKYILKILAERKRQYMNPYSEEADFYTKLKVMVCSAARFMLSEPELHVIYRNFISNKQLVKEVFGGNSLEMKDYLVPLLEEGKSKGLVRNNLDLHFIAQCISILLTQLVFDKIDSPEVMAQSLDAVSDKIIDFINQGISTGNSVN